MMSSPKGIHHADHSEVPQRDILTFAGYHITKYHGRQASVPLDVHHESRGGDWSHIVLDHGCSPSLTQPLHNVHEGIHHALMVHAHGGVQHPASGHQYPTGFDQMSSHNNREVNNMIPVKDVRHGSQPSAVPPHVLQSSLLTADPATRGSQPFAMLGQRTAMQTTPSRYVKATVADIETGIWRP
jgi:hypothetical protein